MEKLTTEKKLEIMREAKKSYINSIQGSDPDEYSVICGRLGYALENNGIVDRYWSSSTVQKLFPEFMDYKPEDVPKGEVWWPRGDTKTRLEVFDKLEAEYIAQIEASLPWYTKLFNKIKKAFQWKS